MMKKVLALIMVVCILAIALVACDKKPTVEPADSTGEVVNSSAVDSSAIDSSAIDSSAVESGAVASDAIAQ